VTILAIFVIATLVISTRILIGLFAPPIASKTISLAIGLLLLGKFFYSSIREIPAVPPTKGVLLFLRRRQKRIMKEGWCFLPLYPIVFDVVFVDMTSYNQDLAEQDIRTPDNVELGVKVSITWTPGASSSDEKKEAEALINFQNKGGREGVANILQDIVWDRLRMWTFSKEEGPSNWQEMIGSKDEAVAILLKATLGDDIPSIPSTIPTSVLLKYFNVPQKKPLQYEKQWGRKNPSGSDWEGLEEGLNKLTPNELQVLKEAVEHRRDIIIKARQGNGAFVKKSLGITINRFTIPSVVLRGEVAKAAELKAKERLEREAEKVELSHVRDRAKMLKKTLEIKSEPALEVVQTERGKVKKEIRKSEFSISSETQGMVERIVSGILDKLGKS